MVSPSASNIRRSLEPLSPCGNHAVGDTVHADVVSTVSGDVDEASLMVYSTNRL